ncbi:MAG: hypothetical protein IPL84_16950 [Chitinophagaceae bacterium]|nr:hypothetical protein [Chitinophagaceae bacterium]
MRKVILLLVLVSAVVFNACKKSDEVLDVATVNDYNPLLVGKYITYDLDSTVFINFGAKDTVVKYQVKLVVDALIADNLGRPAYRIIRYIRKTPANPWNPDNTFMAVPTDFTLEFVENNMRFIKLKGPVRDGLTWKGNTYIDTYSLNSNVKYLADWDYTYENVGQPMVLGAITLDNTLYVNQRDEIIGNTGDPNSYHEINFSAENYAKDIGMVYRDFLHIEYQPPTPGRAGYRLGYGVKMTMIDHN